MKKAKSKILLSILILPAYIFLSVFNTEGALLCFGNDGHIAIEFVDACGGQVSESGIAETGHIDACGPCTDVYFASDSAHLKNTLNEMNTLIGLSDNPLTTSGYIDNARQEIPADSLRPPFNRSLSSLNSIVLLI